MCKPAGCRGDGEGRGSGAADAAPVQDRNRARHGRDVHHWRPHRVLTAAARHGLRLSPDAVDELKHTGWLSFTTIRHEFAEFRRARAGLC